PDLPQGDALPPEARRVLRPAARQGQGQAPALLRDGVRDAARLAQGGRPPRRPRRRGPRRARRAPGDLPLLGRAAESALPPAARVLPPRELLPVRALAIQGPLRGDPAAPAGRPA